MNAPLTIFEVTLGANHLRPGRTRHAILGPNGEQEFPPFVRLEIAQYSGDNGFYLLHICEHGEVADTYHDTVDEAMHQAEWEFGVQRGEWRDVRATAK
jgi:hypothetical protein